MSEKKINSERKIISEAITEISPYELETTLGKLSERINELISTYGTEAKLDWDPNRNFPYDSSPSPVYYIRVNREETDVEYLARLACEKDARILQDKRDLADFMRLQKKLGLK
jgi:hypothetical protein